LEPHLTNDLLSAGEFRKISELAFRASGIDLGDRKRHLVQARLGRKIRQGNFASFDAYYRHVVADRTGQELTALLDALTTNFTSFLREPSHFEFLRKTILPGLNQPEAGRSERAGPVRIWSAACSTGEEPYTIAFSLLEELGMVPAASRIRILATDLSTRVLETAAQAAYPAERFGKCPPDWPRKYLLRGRDRWEGWYRVRPQVRRLIEFRRLNLMETFRPEQRFHVIFCRNVMIYFDKHTQERLVNRLAACLEPGGYLLIGHSESLTGLSHPYTNTRPAIYRMPS
jgi:chemotaxis protein methyltransferase CheR